MKRINKLELYVNTELRIGSFINSFQQRKMRELFKYSSRLRMKLCQLMVFFHQKFRADLELKP